jgi:hypothetical protein
LCVIGLTIRSRPTAAWLACVAALSAVTLDLVGVARDRGGVAPAAAWAWWSIGICLAANAATDVAI